MQTLILAAGFATRLYPLTENTPKHLLDIAGRPMLDYLVDTVVRFYEETGEGYPVNIVVNGKFAPQFREWASRKDVPINIIDNGVICEEDRLGAVGDFALGISNIFSGKNGGKCGALLTLAGDNLYEFRLDDLYKYFLKYGSVIAVHDLKDRARLAKKFGVVEHDDSYRVTGFEEKPSNPKTSLAATVVYMFTGDDIARLRHDYLSQNDVPDNIGLMVKWMAETGMLSAWPSQEGWIDIGSKDDLERVRRDFTRRASRA